MRYLSSITPLIQFCWDPAAHRFLSFFSVASLIASSAAHNARLLWRCRLPPSAQGFIGLLFESQHAVKRLFPSPGHLYQVTDLFLIDLPVCSNVSKCLSVKTNLEFTSATHLRTGVRTHTDVPSAFYSAVPVLFEFHCIVKNEIMLHLVSL